jgi:copper chaperone for superoxide dismutase
MLICELLRGLGAAVSILEAFHDRTVRIEEGGSQREVVGLARFVQVSDSSTLVDISVRGLAPGTYRATIRELGDVKSGASSTGAIWAGSEEGVQGDLGSVQVGEDGRGGAFVDGNFKVWEIIGRAMAVSRQSERDGILLQNDGNTVVGVVARSAGMWENDKTICSCTGKTLWEERQEQIGKGML